MSIYAFPVGSTTDVPFSDADLLRVWLEFPSSGHDTAYFANDKLTVICMPSVLNPSVQWCSTAAEANPWVTMPGLPFAHHSLVVPDPPVPSIPEPAYGVLVFVAIAFVVLARGKR